MRHDNDGLKQQLSFSLVSLYLFLLIFFILISNITNIGHPTSGIFPTEDTSKINLFRNYLKTNSNNQTKIDNLLNYNSAEFFRASYFNKFKAILSQHPQIQFERPKFAEDKQNHIISFSIAIDALTDATIPFFMKASKKQMIDEVINIIKSKSLVKISTQIILIDNNINENLSSNYYKLLINMTNYLIKNNIDKNFITLGMIKNHIAGSRIKFVFKLILDPY